MGAVFLHVLGAELEQVGDEVELDVTASLEVVVEGEESGELGEELGVLSFEIGYLRYDYDERYNNGDIHPLNHLDINFTNGSTFKLGLKEKINQTVLDDIVDTGTNCHYLVKS